MQFMENPLNSISFYQQHFFKKSEIFNFDDDNFLHFYGSNTPLVLRRLLVIFYIGLK